MWKNHNKWLCDRQVLSYGKDDWTPGCRTDMTHITDCAPANVSIITTGHGDDIKKFTKSKNNVYYADNDHN